MTFLQPGWLLAAAAVAAGLLALHFLSRRRPRPAPLPTARFVPDTPAHAPSRGRRPTDLLLMALRAASALAIGAALAGPTVAPARRSVARIVLADVSRAARSLGEVRDSALSWATDGDVLIVYDSTARIVRGDRSAAFATAASESAGPRVAAAPAGPPGSLSAALALAVRVAGELRARADSLQLVVVSPFAREGWDRATPPIRRMWTGAARLVPVEAVEPRPAPRIALDARPDDPLRFAVALLGTRSRAAAETRIVRRAPTALDSSWAGATGGALVVWPVEPEALWPRADRADTVGAVTLPGLGAADALVVAAEFARHAFPPPGTPLARWVDGRPAAVERPLGAGCERDVAIPIAAAGDLALRPSVRRLVVALAEPCGGAADLAPLGDTQLALLRGGGGLLAASDVRPTEDLTPPATGLWLLGLAAALLIAEMLARSRMERGEERAP